MQNYLAGNIIVSPLQISVLRGSPELAQGTVLAPFMSLSGWPQCHAVLYCLAFPISTPRACPQLLALVLALDAKEHVKL